MSDRGHEPSTATPPVTAAAEVFRADYRPPPYLINEVDLTFELALPVTRVTSRLHFRRQAAAPEPLLLNGAGQEVLDLRLDGRALDPAAFERVGGDLIILRPPDAGILEVTTQATAEGPGGEGLLNLNGVLVTHCEPEGFRRITYFPDRPDVLARFRVTLIAERTAFPTLLSNGLLVEEGVRSDGRIFAVWRDPYPKACYLFALAAGRFDTIGERFETRSGRQVSLTVHAAADDLAYCRHGLRVLREAMAWDETAYGREYDLDVLNVVVLPSYPGGAMENKGLNLYATEFFLADPAISTDEALLRVEAVIGHEYFHNWTGVRVGCRSWFELSLKEGFTVLRQQDFMAAGHGAAEMRIDDLIRLQELQYPEDDGALAHPVRLVSYRTISNAYTRTIYEKAAELIRMMRGLVGEAAFQAGSAAFFAACDGRAASIGDLIDALEQAGGRDLTQFRRWYDTAGRPRLTFAGAHDADRGEYAVTLGQGRLCAEGPLHIPVRLGFLDPDGAALRLRRCDEADPREDHLLELTADEQTWTFAATAAPTPSILRGGLAPVDLETDLGAASQARLAKFDTDPVVRWRAIQSLALEAIRTGDSRGPAARAWIDAAETCLAEAPARAGLVARLLRLPTQAATLRGADGAAMDRLLSARTAFAGTVGRSLEASLRAAYWINREAGAAEAAFGARALKAACLELLMAGGGAETVRICRDQFHDARGMQDAFVALQLLIEHGERSREALATARARWASNPHALDNWYRVQACAATDAAPGLVAEALRGPDWQWANATRVKAVFDAFCANPRGFHAPDGSGYDLVASAVRALAPDNPRLAARFLKAFAGWRAQTTKRQARARENLIELTVFGHLPRELGGLIQTILKAETAA